MTKKILVTGAGGFIGSHLVTLLKNNGYWVRGVDLKYPEFSKIDADQFVIADLRNAGNCIEAVDGVDAVCALAADMGGMGFISCHHSEILYNNAMINFNTLDAAKNEGIKNYLYTSSACVYPEYRQLKTDIPPLKESDAYPAQPQDAYGWEKLITEQLCTHYGEDYGMNMHIVRFHNIFGPEGTWIGGREKAPAALCRKIAVAKIIGDPVVDIWGDGKQTRSFCYIDDCTEGIYRLMKSDFHEPLNLGQDRMISINDLADTIAGIADYHIELNHISGPEGVRGRNSDNTLLRKTLKWEPRVSLETGLEFTYRWIEKRIKVIAKTNPESLPDLSVSHIYGCGK